MKRVLTISCALTLLTASTASAQIQYGFSISASPTDATINTAPALPSFAGVSVYLWMACTWVDGISAAEFSLNYVAPPSVFGWALTMHNGWLNAGTVNNLLLAVGGCPTDEVLVGTWSGFNTGAPIAHNFCLIPSPGGVLGGVDCSPTPQVWPVKQVGLAAGVAQACSEALCPPVDSVEAETWGSIKSLYR